MSLNIKSNPYRFLLGTVLVVILSLLLSSSYIAKYLVKQWFEDQGATIAIDNLALSIVNSKLTLEGFNAHKNEQQLALDQLQFEWQWWPLLNNHLVIDELLITGLTLDVLTEQNQLKQIGPIILTADGTANKTSRSSGTPWQISHSNLAIHVKSLCAHGLQPFNGGIDQQLFIQTLQPESGIVGHANQRPSDRVICLSSQVDWKGGGKLDLSDSLKVNSRGDLAVNQVGLTLDGISLYRHDAFLINDLNWQLTGFEFAQLSIRNLQLGTPWKSQNQPDTINTASNPGFITNFSGSLKQLNVEQVSWNAHKTQLQITQTALDDLRLNRFFLDQYTELATIETFSLENFEQSSDLIRLNKILLLNIGLLANTFPLPNQSKHFLSGFSSVELQQLELNSQSLAAKTLSIAGTFANLAIGSDGDFNFTPWLEIFQTQKTTSTRPSVAVHTAKVDAVQTNFETSEIFSFHVQQFELKDSQDIVLSDHSLSRPIHQKLSALEISVSQFNNLGNPFNTQLFATLNDSGKFELSGPAQFDNTLNKKTQFNTAFKGSINGLDLAQLSPYSERFIGYRIDQGLLNSNLEFKANQSDIESLIDLNFHKFELGALEQEEQHPLNKELGIPLPLALKLLKDSDGNIDIELPVTGALNEPDVSINDILTTVSVKAIKSAIIYQYSPFGLLTLASGAIDLATGLSFDPVIFENTSDELTPKHLEQLDNIANLLQQKPQLSLVLCGQSSLLDLQKSEPQNKLESSTNDSRAQGTLPITDEQKQHLLQLARNRQSAIASYLTQKSSIPTEKIIMCNVKLGDIKTQQPIVKINV